MDTLAAFNRAIGCGSLKQEIFLYAIACAVLLDDFDEVLRLHRLMRRSCEWVMTSKIETAAFRLAHDIINGTVPCFRQARSDKRWERRKKRRVDSD